MRKLIFAFLLLIVACGDDFTPYNEVNSLRILAMRETPSWPAPGETAILDALVVDPSGANASFAWSWCPLVGSASDGYPCLVEEDALRQELNRLSPGSGATLPAFDLGQSSTAAFPHTVDPVLWRGVCEFLLRAPAGASGITCDETFPVTVVLEVSVGEKTVRGKKTVRLRYDAADPGNENPALNGLYLERAGKSAALDDTGSVAVRSSEEVVLGVTLSDNAAESYADSSGESQRERVLFTWFIGAGETEALRTTFIEGEVSWEDATRNRWTPPKASDGPIGIWVVAHDSRGGVGFLTAQVALEVSP